MPRKVPFLCIIIMKGSPELSHCFRNFSAPFRNETRPDHIIMCVEQGPMSQVSKTVMLCVRTMLLHHFNPYIRPLPFALWPENILTR